MNDQRKVIFEQRVDLMRGSRRRDGGDMRRTWSTPAAAMCRRTLSGAVGLAGAEESPACRLDLPVDALGQGEGIADEELIARVRRGRRAHGRQGGAWGPDVLRYVEKSILLQTLVTCGAST